MRWSLQGGLDVRGVVIHFMENHGESSAPGSAGREAVKREVLGFFKRNPFLLVSEERLSVMLCRPPDMVLDAVRSLEDAGLLKRRSGGTLLGVEEGLAEVEAEI